MNIIAVNPSTDFKKAHEWAKNYTLCNDCQFLGVLNLETKDVPVLVFKTNYQHEDVIQYINDITSIDGTYYKLV